MEGKKRLITEGKLGVLHMDLACWQIDLEE